MRVVIQYNLIDESIDTLLVNKDKTTTRFLVITDSKLEANDRPAGLRAEAYKVVMPKMSNAKLVEESKNCQKRIEEIDQKITDSALCLSSLKVDDPPKIAGRYTCTLL